MPLSFSESPDWERHVQQGAMEGLFKGAICCVLTHHRCPLCCYLQRVSAASLLGVSADKDKKGKAYYNIEILTRTGEHKHMSLGERSQ